MTENQKSADVKSLDTEGDTPAEEIKPTFSDLGLSAKILKAVGEAGYTHPTPIQAQSIPHALQRRDVLGIAQTGTGKTASFVLPMLNLLERGRARARMPRTLILTPTRELAAQVEENFIKYGQNHRLTVALLIGGVSFDEQIKKLDRGADVLIATPGRLIDHFERGRLLLTGVEVFVIDEADRMLDMGFIPDIERISKLIPFTRQTLFFSATMPPEIQKLADVFLSNPARVEVARQVTTASTVTQRLVNASGKDYEKRAILRDLIKNAEDLQNAIIFCNRKKDVSDLFRSLQKHGFDVGALHGDMDQRSRTTILENFRAGKLPILVASDVAARGLDVPEVSHVFNFDVPHHAEDYVHRIGRTGRAGRKGTAYTLVTADDQKSLGAVHDFIQTEIEWHGDAIDFEAAAAERKDRKRGTRGRRSSAKGKVKTATASATNEVLSSNNTEKPAPRKRRARTKPSDEGSAVVQKATDEGSTASNEPVQRERNTRKGRNNKDNDPPIIGLGDHVPDFLLRPVR